jgi:hypothetical protein
MLDDNHQRGITQKFEDQLKSGILQPLLQRVQHDDTLNLEIRNGYVDIYYRGGRLLGIHAQANADKFSTYFDERYCNVKEEYRPILPERPCRVITSADHARAWVDAFAFYKQVMDIRFSEHPKLEREYQQAVVRDNNRHASGKASDYVVIDVEYAQSPRAFPEQNANYRFDMVGFRRPANRKTRANCVVTPVIMEMKIGDAALRSPKIGKKGDDRMPGLVKHVLDIERFLTPSPGEKVSRPYAHMCKELVRIFETKKHLELPSLPEAMGNLKLRIDVNLRPEVLFILTSHNPTSTILEGELKELRDLRICEHADYGIATVSYTGYALFEENIIPLDEFECKRTAPE